jgi:membrane associated rhomboid family serine protease
MLLYITAIPGACMFTYFKQRNNPSYNALGASGAVAAIVFSFILMHPMAKLYLYGGIPINGVIFGVLYLAYSSYMGKRGGDNVGHEAHFWGSVYGFLFTGICKPELFPFFIEQIRQLF